MNNTKGLPIPVRPDPKEEKSVGDLAGNTGMSKAEIIRRCLRFALPKFISGEANILDHGKPQDQSATSEATV